MIGNQRRIEHSVSCPAPDCRWQARGGFDVPDGAEPGVWRIGVIRDAVERARLAHVVEKHVEILPTGPDF